MCYQSQCFLTHLFSQTAVAVGFEQATYLVGESAAFLLYRLHIWGWLEREVIVDITASNGSAIRELLLTYSFWW